MEFCNTSSLDRAVRLGLGLLMLVLGWQPWLGGWAFVFRVVALYPLITGVVGWCPVYAMLRIGTKQPPSP